MTAVALTLHVRPSRHHLGWRGRPEKTWSVLQSAVGILLERWRPAALQVTNTRFDEYEQPELPGRTMQLDVRDAAWLDALVDAHEIIASDPLLVRLVVPDSETAPIAIRFVDPDHREREGRLVDAPAMDALSTRWLDPDCPLQRGFVVYVPERGQIEVQWDPGLFAGSPGTSSWAEWDRRLDEMIEQTLRGLGFVDTSG